MITGSIDQNATRIVKTVPLNFTLSSIVRIEGFMFCGPSKTTILPWGSGWSSNDSTLVNTMFGGNIKHYDTLEIVVTQTSVTGTFNYYIVLYYTK